MKLRILLSSIGLFSLSACITPFSYEGDARQGYMHVTTYPAKATLKFPDGSGCETPCRVKVPQAIPMTIAKAGYKAINTTLAQNSKGRISYNLELSAPTTSVEESALPDL